MFTTGKVTGPHRILVIYRRSAPITGALAEIEGPRSRPPGGPHGPWVTGIRWRLFSWLRASLDPSRRLSCPPGMCSDV